MVPQELEDEPASALLERIKEKRQQLKKENTLLKVEDEEILHSIPKSWKWTRLDQVVDYTAADKVASSDISGDSWLLDLEDIERDTSKVLRRKLFKEQPSKSTKASPIQI